MKHLYLILLALLIASCSAERKLERIIANNPELAATKVEVRTDTLIRDSIRIFETSVLKTQYDTVEVIRTEYQYRIVRLPGDSFEVLVEIPADTIYHTDTVSIRTIEVDSKAKKAEIKAAKRKARKWGFFWGLLVGSITVLIIWQRKRIVPLVLRLFAGL